jgi:anti-sigma regulatory factor (Ser/Thr protein kinase)
MSVSAAYKTAEQSHVHVEADLDAAVALMTVRGVWDEPLKQLAAATLHRCLSQHPEALIIDLSALSDPSCRSATTWTAVQQSAGALEPIVELAMCIPPSLPLADRMQRLGCRGKLPVYAKVRQARVAIAGRLPTTDRRSLTLAGEPESPSIARHLVGEACLEWGLGELLHPSRTVMSELITNAIEHARTPVTVTIGKRGAGVHITVSDGSSALPAMIKPARPRRGHPLDDRGRGLRVVAATADAWGALPTPAGKVVWATLTASRLTGPR